ncbi:DsbA family protein [Pseudomonas sp. NFX224]|uniref:DsbA family protein n=1 Tax=Pseudomonas sp. NFX224 TaxID=3402862 RepID=UPI003AFB46ED
MSAPQLIYVFDPLCGWCYACAPALAALAHSWPDRLEMLPSGLFSETGARELSPDWARYAWGNDQRIEDMTGQIFSEDYHRDVLLGKNVRFDSALINRALTAIRAIDPTLEPKLLHELQVARYIKGRNTAEGSVVAQVASTVASLAGQVLDASAFESRLHTDELLADETYTRIQATQRFMNQLNIRGVPQLLLHADGKFEAIDSSELYQNPAPLVDRLRRRLS